MITSDNERNVSPNTLAQQNSDSAKREQAHASDYEQWRDSYDNTSAQQADSSLQLSRALALSAIVLVAAAFLFPESFSILFFGWGVFLLYCLHSFYQNRKTRDVLDKSSVGMFAALPKSSMLWGVSIPLALTGIVSTIMSNGFVHSDVTTRWVGLSILAAVCCSVVSWSMRGPLHKAKTLGFVNGMSLGIGIGAFCLFSAIAVISEQFATYGLALALSSLMIIYSGSLIKQLLLRADRARSFAVFCAACVGTLATLAVGLGPELRGIAIALGEKFAVSKDRPIADAGYRLLSMTNPAPELKGSWGDGEAQRDSVATSLIPVNTNDIEKMYFFVTGKSIAGQETSGTTPGASYEADSKLLPGLSLVESKLTGHVDANALTAVTYWTLTFGNKHGADQEAQARIALPPHSTISRATLWINGVPQEAAFNSTGRVTQAYNWIVSYHRDPLLITELTPGLVKIQASPVPHYGEMKVRLGITYGLEPKSKRDFSLKAPKIISSNFNMEDVDTSVKLESNAPITSSAGGVQKRSGSKYTYNTSISPSTENGWQFVAHRDSDFTGYTARATHSAEDMVISESLIAPSADVKRLAIVIEGSKAIAEHADGIKEALSHIPSHVQAKVFVADHRDQAEAFDVKEAISQLGKVELSGGVDDVPALKLAAKYLGRSENAAILWIHGNQPVLFQEDKEAATDLMVRGKHRIKIYDVQLGQDSPNAIQGYLSSLSSTACPEVRSIAQSKSIQRDLGSFFKSAGADGVDFQIVREKVPNKHLSSTSYDFPIASRLSTVWAADEARKCNSSGDVATAELLGNVYRVVTPATGAVVLETESDYSHESLKRNFYSVVSKDAHAKKGGTVDGTSTLDRDDVDQPVQDSLVGWGDRAKRVSSAEFESKAEVNKASADVTQPTPMPTPSAAPMYAGMVPPPPAVVAQTTAMESRRAVPSAAPKAEGVSGAPGLEGATNGIIGGFYDKSPSLIGATNGTIGPQYGDETFVTSAGSAPAVNSFSLDKLFGLACTFGSSLMVFAGLFFLGKGFFLRLGKDDAAASLMTGSILLVFAVTVLKLLLRT